MNDVGSLLKRPRHYYNVDGMGELGMGFMCLGFALLQWLQVHTPKDAIWHQTYALFVYVGIMCLAIKYGTKAIKKRITYPRTGSVEYRKRDTILPMIIGGAVSVSATIPFYLAIRFHWNLTTPASLVGLAFAACYAYGIAGTVWWKWVVVWAMTLGSVVIAFLPPSFFGALADDSWVTHPVRTKLVGAFLLSVMMFGTMLLISGGASFWLYLRHTQPPAQEGQ